MDGIYDNIKIAKQDDIFGFSERSSFDFDQSQNEQQQEQRGSNSNESKADQFGFGSFVEKQFDGTGQMGGALNSAAQKQLFTNVDINVFVPKDPSIITSTFKVVDMIEDEFEKLDRLHFVVSIPGNTGWF